MANLSQQRREQMLSFLETLKEQHNDDASLIAINQIEKELTSKKYGLVWEEHEEEVDVKMKTHIPVFTEIKEKEIVENSESDEFNFLLEGDIFIVLGCLKKHIKGKLMSSILIHHTIRDIRILFMMMHLLIDRMDIRIVSGFHLWKKD